MIQLRKRLVGSIVFTLLFQASLSGQTELTSLQTAIEANVKASLSEKAFVHTDKEFYTAGEILWFKMYVVDGIFQKPLPASKIGYVELLDRANRPVLQAKIGLNEKGGDGSMQLPVTLSSGNYTLRAYTAWMKNTGPDLFFEKRLTIVNPLKSLDAVEEKKAPAYRLQLFPEGGNLVSGLRSKVAFHLTDSTGKGVQAKGYLLNEKGDTLLSFDPYKFGMGHFSLAPQNGDSYKVIFQLHGRTIVSQPLPTIYQNGYTMQLEERENNQLKITVQSNPSTLSPDVYLLAQTRQVVKAVQKSGVINNEAVFIINKNLLGEGVSQFTIFDSKKNPVCERLFFVPPSLKNSITLRASKPQYGLRDKVEIAIDSLPDAITSMSLSVHQVDGLPAPESSSIDEYLWLTSELNGAIEKPSYYFSAASDDVKKTTDYLMLTNGWRRFNWEAVIGPKPVLKFKRESAGHVITGKVTDTRTKLAASGVQVFLSLPASPQKLFTSISDSSGFVQFEVMNYYSGGELFVQTNTQSDSLHTVEIISPFSDVYTANGAPSFTLLPSYQKALLNRSISMQAQHLYLADSFQQFFKPSIPDTFPFYGKPLFTYKLDDYVRFTTMEEVLREYVAQISVGVKGSGASLRFKMFNDIDQEVYTTDNLVLVDGIPLFNANRIFSFDPLKIKQLDIINRNYIVGNFRFHGLANFITYANQYEGLELDPNVVAIDYEGLQLQREFYSPDYSSNTQRSNRLPDLRTTLYWSPNISAKQISFYTGDNKGRYVIVLQGIDPGGHAINTSSVIEVK